MAKSAQDSYEDWKKRSQKDLKFDAKRHVQKQEKQNKK